MRTIFISLVLTLLVLCSCTNELIYRSDFDQQKVEYYSACLRHEENIQKQNIESIQKVQEKSAQLCATLYQRLPEKRDQDQIIAIGLKMYRLKEAIETLALMREHFYNAFKLTYTDIDPVRNLLDVQFHIEIKQMEDFLVHLAEVNARIHYLDDFRQETTIKTDAPEQRLEDFKVVFQNAENDLKKMIYEKSIQHFSDVGVAVTKDQRFKFTASPRTLNTSLHDEASLFPSSSADDVSDYSYVFAEEKEVFKEHFVELKNSIERFRSAIDKYRDEAVGGTEKLNNAHLASQLSNITFVMESNLGRVEGLFYETLDDLKNLVGGREFVDETLWSQVKRDSKEIAAKKNFDYYKGSVIALNTSLLKTLALENAESESSKFLKRLLALEKYFNETDGTWGTGYKLLGEEWQQKTSFKRLADEFRTPLGEIERVSKNGGLRPLWTTCRDQYSKHEVPPFKIANNGYLVKND